MGQHPCCRQSGEYKKQDSQPLPPQCNKLHFASTGSNEGLSFAYNRAIEYAKAHGYTHLMTMDQDSKWENFKEYKQECENQFVKYNNAIIGPCINDIKREKTIKLVPHVINSGLIIPISTIKRIGMYSERFIIDAIDVELCFRANSNNIPTFIIAGNWGLIQKFGNQSFFQLRGSQRVSYNYSPYRLYGIIRNHILLTRMYPEQKANIVRTYKVYLKEFAVSIIFSENNKIIKLKAMVKGLLNGLTTRKSVESKYSKA